MKRTTRILLILIILIVIAFGAARWYLSSSLVASQVAGKLAQVYGGGVDVASIRVGFVGHSTLGDLQLHEAGESSAPVWLKAGHIDTDLSAWDVIRGDSLPGEITVSEATITLRYDQAGHLITKIPRTNGKARGFPNVHLQNSQVILEREGEAQRLRIGGIKADLIHQGVKLLLRGSLNDRSWGDWSVTGEFLTNNYATDVALRTIRPVHVTPEMLREIPFVAQSVWKTVELDGATPGDITFHFDPDKKGPTYTMKLAPINTQVTVPVIQLTATHTSGQVLIENGVIKLRDVRGTGYGGSLDVDANLDFCGPASDLHFYRVKAKQLQLARLPEEFPARIKHVLTPKAELSGHGDLRVVLANGKVRTVARGEAIITHTRLGGPLTVELQGGQDGLHLGQTSANLSREPAASGFSALVGGSRLNRFEPGQLVKRYHAGLLSLMNTLLVGGFVPPARSNRIPQAPRYWEANMKMENVDGAKFLKGIGLKLPVSVSGRFSFAVQVGIPLNATKDLTKYRASGTITAPRLAIEDLPLQEVRAHVTLRKGVLHLEEFKARVPPQSGSLPEREGPSRITGSGTLQVAPLGDLRADLSLRDIPLARAAGLLRVFKDKPVGSLNGTVQVRVPVRQIQSPAAWEGTGTLSAPEVQAAGLTFKKVDAGLRVHQGTLTLAKATAEVAGTRIAGSAVLKLTRPYGYEANATLPALDLAALKQLTPRFRPPVTLAGKLRTTAQATGTLAPFATLSSGDASVADLQMEGVSLAALRFHWQATSDRLAVSDIRGKLYKGEMSGQAVVPLAKKVPGMVNLRFNGLNVAALARAIPRNPLRLAGQANGSIQAVLPSVTDDKERGARVTLDLEAANLQIEGIPTQRVKGRVDYSGDMIDYHLQGQSLGGKFSFQGKLAARSAMAKVPQGEGRLYPTKFRPDVVTQAAAPQEGGRLQVEGIQLRQLWEARNVHNAMGSLGGTLDLDLTYRLEGPQRTPAGTGRLLLRNMRWAQTSLGGVIASGVTLKGEELAFPNLSGRMGAGLLSGHLTLNLKNVDRGRVFLRLDGVDAPALLAPWPALAPHLQGSMDLVLHSSLGREWTGLGRVHMLRGQVAGMGFTDWHMPLHWVIAPGAGHAQIDIRDSSAMLALGHITGHARITLQEGMAVEGGRLQFEGLDVRTLLHELGTGSQYGSGRLTGRFDFSSGGFQALADLSGTLEATLSQVRPGDFPVLRQITPFLRSGQPAASTFSTGELRGTLNRGVFRIQRLSMSSALLQLLLEGNLTVAGAVDLEAMALPGPLAGTSPSRRLLRSVPLVGPVSSRALGVASRVLANEFTHLRVTGTFRNPSVRYEPRFSLSPEGLRFFGRR